MKLHFTGRADILASYTEWRTLWHRAWRRYHANAMRRAAEMRHRLAAALEERA